MNRRTSIVVAAGLIVGSIAVSQNPPANKPQATAVQSANELVEALAQRLSSELHVQTVVGEPVKAGSVTLIPIMMVDVSFGGGSMAALGSRAAAASQSPPMGVDGFFMSGEARPLGFVAIGKKGTRFITFGKTPVK